jgi:hypothetical protein
VFLYFHIKLIIIYSAVPNKYWRGAPSSGVVGRDIDKWARLVGGTWKWTEFGAGAPQSIPWYRDRLGLADTFIGLELTWILYWEPQCSHFLSLEPQ